MVADDHPAFRVGLRALLESAGVVVAGEVETTIDAITLAKNRRFDVAIVDVVLPPLGGVALVRELATRWPHVRILALSMISEAESAAQMLRAGASGYALKSQPASEILEAIRCVAGEVVYLAPDLPADTIHALVATTMPLERLTLRERSVFDLLVAGESSASIAAILQIARSTVEAHRRGVMHKLAADSVVELVQVARRYGLIGRG
jgi:DNA-binding NarL/FixJ family response regulator